MLQLSIHVYYLPVTVTTDQLSQGSAADAYIPSQVSFIMQFFCETRLGVLSLRIAISLI